jgi:hypothetical protein
MRVMGLDVSVKATGIAVVGLHPDMFVPEIGTLRRSWWARAVGYGLPEDATFEQTHKRIEVINEAIIAAVTMFEPDLVAIEQAVGIRQGQEGGFGNNAKMQLWAMNMIAQHTVFRLRKRVRLVPVGTWRAHFGISSPQVKKENQNATSAKRSALLKDLARQRMLERFGAVFMKNEHNEAEAFAIAQFALFEAENPPAVQNQLFGGK